MRYIDFHCHAFPDKIAQAAVESLARKGGGLIPRLDGSWDALAREAQEDPDCAYRLLLPIATKPTQQQSINNWAASHQKGKILSFGSIHPDAPDALEELTRIQSLGLKGVKFHPEYQNFYVDDPKMLPIYRRISSLGLITVFHAGADVAYMPPYRCTPDRLLRILPVFGGTPVVAAHFGGYMMWEEVFQKLCGLPIYLDTAFSHGHIIQPLAHYIIKKHGAERILFGSDSPWSSPRNELKLIESLELSPMEQNQILYENAAKLLKSK